jgi:hypothetical protein
MVPRRPAGSALEDERLSKRGIGEGRPGSAGVPARIRDASVRGWDMHGPPSSCGLRARGRAPLQAWDRRGAHLGAPSPSSASSEGASAPVPPGSAGVPARIRDASVRGWDMHGPPSPCGLRARGRAPLQAWDWRVPPGSAGVLARIRGPWLPTAGVCQGYPSPCGLRARGRAPLQAWDWRGLPWERRTPARHLPRVHQRPSPLGAQASVRALARGTTPRLTPN